jgi:sugar lactone lactonase YvrE
MFLLPPVPAATPRESAAQAERASVAAPSVRALAPFELLARAAARAFGIVGSPDGRIFFSDEIAGTISEVGAGGSLRLISDRLRRPRGLAWESPGQLLAIAQRVTRSAGGIEAERSSRGILVRISLDSGAVAILASGLKRPRGLARGADGAFYISSDGLRRPETNDLDEEQEYEKDESEEEERDDDRRTASFEGTISRWTPAGALQQVARGFKRPHGLAISSDGTILVAAEHFRNGDRRLEGSIFAIASSGMVTTRLTTRLRRPSDLAVDFTGALFLSAEDRANRRRGSPGLVLKLQLTSTSIEFASGLERPRGMAFTPEGHLLVVDAWSRAIWRFDAPVPPTPDVEPDSATNQNPFVLRGASAPGTLVVVDPQRSSGASGTNGRFEIPITLSANVLNTLSIRAIGSSGNGLASAAATARIVHDNWRWAVACPRSPSEGEP